jgi:hypothetical protein
MALWLVRGLLIAMAMLVLAGSSWGRQFDVKIVDERVVISDDDQRVFGAEIRAPQFCPYDSNWLAFETREAQQINLYLYNRVTTEITEVTPGQATAPARLGGSSSTDKVRSFDLHWRPVPGPGNDRWFVFCSDAAGGSLDLWLGEAVGGKFIHLKNRYEGKAETGPRWSPDGEVIAYVSDAFGGGDIYILPQVAQMFAKPDKDLSSDHHRVVASEGLDYEIRWYPKEMAGYFAYTHQDPPEQGSRLVETRICDAVNDASYRMQDAEAGRYLRSPSWDPTGKPDVAFYQTDEYPERGKQVSWGVGMAYVEFDDPVTGSVNFRMKSPGASRGWFASNVRPPEDLKSGPVWTPDGRFLALTLVREEEDNPLWLFDISDWEFGLRHRSDNSFAPAYKHPSELTISGKQISFTYIDGPNTKLLSGQLTGSHFSLPDPTTEWPLYTDARGQQFYDKYIETPSAFEKFGRWLTSPIVGPNIGINTNLVFWPAAIGAAAIIFGGDGNGPDIETWNPPGFVDN